MIKPYKLNPDRRWRLGRVLAATDAGGGFSLVGATAGGSAQLRPWNEMREAGWVEFVRDPSIKGTARTKPLMAVITEAGRKALETL